MVFAGILQKRGAVDQIHRVAVEADGIGGIAVKVAQLVAGEVADFAVQIQRVDLCQEAGGIAELLRGEEGLDFVQRRGGIAHCNAENVAVGCEFTRRALHGEALHETGIVGVRAAERNVRYGVLVVEGILLGAAGCSQAERKNENQKEREKFVGFHDTISS